MKTKGELKKEVKRIAKAVNALRTQLAHSIHKEEYEQAASFRDEAQLLQKELILLINEKITPS